METPLHEPRLRLFAWATLLTLLLLVGGACGGQTGDTSDGNEPAGNDEPAGGTSQPNQATTSTNTQPSVEQLKEGDPADIPGQGTVSVDQALGALNQLTRASDPQVAAQPPTSSGTQGQSLDGFIQAVGTDMDSFWAQTFESWNSGGASQCQYGQGQYDQYDPSQCPVGTPGQFSYESPPLTVFTGSVDTVSCDQVMQSVYCPVDGDHGIYIERGEAQEAYEQIGDTDGADFAVAYLVAHEYGHHVQAELGYFDPNNPEVAQPFKERSVPFENQADCLAGVWAYYAGYRGLLEDDDIREAQNHAATIGDTRYKWERSHGTAEERQAWFNQGYTTGDSSQCVGYEFSP